MRRLFAWQGQAQPLLYDAKVFMAVYSSGWACPCHVCWRLMQKSYAHPNQSTIITKTSWDNFYHTGYS